MGIPQRTQDQPKLTMTSELKRLPNNDFNRDVTAVAMDERFYLIGQVDGTLAAVYISNGNNVFNSKVSDYPITAVACEEKDDADNQIFYAGDEEGNLFTVYKKGNFTTSIANFSVDGDGTFHKKKGSGD